MRDSTQQDLQTLKGGEPARCLGACVAHAVSPFLEFGCIALGFPDFPWVLVWFPGDQRRNVRRIWMQEMEAAPYT